MFLRHLVHSSSIDFHGNLYGDRPRGTHPSGGGLNARGLAKYSDFLATEGHVLETVQDRRM